MKAFYVSLILFVSRAWDAVTDPLVGYLVSRSKWTPIGKLTPWWVIFVPPEPQICQLSCTPSLFVSQAAPLHAIWSPVVRARVVSASGLHV